MVLGKNMNLFNRNPYKRNPESSGETQELKYAPGQRVWLEKITSQGDKIAILGEVTVVSSDGKVRVKEPFSKPTFVPDLQGVENKFIEVVPENEYDKTQLEQWQIKYGK